MKVLVLALIAKPLISMGGLGWVFAYQRVAVIHDVEAHAMRAAQDAELEARRAMLEAREAEARARAAEEAPEQEP